MFALLIKAGGKQKEAGSHSENKIFHFHSSKAPSCKSDHGVITL